MKALKFVTDVRSDADYADIPEQAIFEIDEKAAARIAALSRMVSASEAHKIEVFDARTVWLKEEAKSDEEADDPENQERVELDSLVVSNEEFWFAGYLKHTNVRIFTARQRIDSLLNYFGVKASETAEVRARQFIESMARLSLWDWSNEAGEPVNECSSPSDVYEDSHAALMTLIEEARALSVS